MASPTARLAASGLMDRSEVLPPPSNHRLWALCQMDVRDKQIQRIGEASIWLAVLELCETLQGFDIVV